jgi:drug/metabolite transporter (DMT)-like permease
MTAAFAVLLGLTWIFSGLAVDRSSPDVVAAGRSFFSCLGIMLLLTRDRGALRRSVGMIRKRPFALLLSGLLGVAIYAFGSLQAIGLLGVSVPNLLVATTPCLSMIIGILWFAKRGNPRAWAGIALATVGAAGYVLGSFALGRHLGWPLVLLGLGCGIAAVISIAFYGQHYARIAAGHDPLDLLPGIFGFGTLILLVLLAVTGRLSAIFHIDLVTLLLLVVLGVAIYVPVYVLQHQLIHLRGAVYMAAVSLVVPFIVRAMEIVFLHAALPNLVEVASMIICVAGVALVVRHPLADRNS